MNTNWTGEAVTVSLAAILDKLEGRLPFAAKGNIAAAFRVGSHSHGTHIPPADPQGIDDTDFMVVVIPPVEWKLGMRSFETLTVQEDGYDIVVYEWSKFLSLLLKSNPNVVGTLWLESEDALLSDLPAVQALFANRNDLMSMKLAPAFVGYAKSQLHKMTHCASEGYMGAKRKALVAEHGYDVKNAAHMIRLLRMGIEVLETGRIIVRRPDADELVTIKRGGWTLDRVSEEAQSLFTRADVALANTKLRAAPDWDFVDMIVREGYLQHWARKGHR